MSTSKLLLLGTSIFGNYKPFNSVTTKILSPHFTKPYPSSSPPLNFRLCASYSFSSSSAAAVDSTIDEGDSELHPWPEWVSFIDRLRSKGYFLPSTCTALEPSESSLEYKDVNLLKDPCLSFARDRFDFFKSLSTKDVQNVVEGGCPNLLKKAVNSAKRLRAHLRLDEGDVCSACNLRGSCDRAYVILQDTEVAARTVDLVRILLYYALDPLVISGGEKPPGRDIVEASARKLLSELNQLSETSPDPEFQQPVAKGAREVKKSLNVKPDKARQKVKMKRGDWVCPNCNCMNYAKNEQCYRCKEERPKRVAVASTAEMQKGDWICQACLKCKAEGPDKVEFNPVTMKKGDWNCP
ncbi:hypothetical protein RJ641_009627, partial [Dillenia turbinata]